MEKDTNWINESNTLVYGGKVTEYWSKIVETMQDCPWGSTIEQQNYPTFLIDWIEYTPSLFSSRRTELLFPTHPLRRAAQLFYQLRSRCRVDWREYSPHEERNQIWERTAHIPNTCSRCPWGARPLQCRSVYRFRHFRGSRNPSF